MNDELMERLDAAIKAAPFPPLDGDYPGNVIPVEAINRREAAYRANIIKAILSELSAAGYPSVPETPTEEMVEVVRRRWLADVDTIEQLRANLIEDYQAMLKARPV